MGIVVLHTGLLLMLAATSSTGLLVAAAAAPAASSSLTAPISVTCDVDPAVDIMVQTTFPCDAIKVVVDDAVAYIPGYLNMSDDEVQARLPVLQVFLRPQLGGGKWWDTIPGPPVARMRLSAEPLLQEFSNNKPREALRRLRYLVYHEMATLLQNSGSNVGLADHQGAVRGIADFLASSAGLRVPERCPTPVRGYYWTQMGECTAADFFAYIESRKHPCFVAKLNARLAPPDALFTDCFVYDIVGETPRDLWLEYLTLREMGQYTPPRLVPNWCSTPILSPQPTIHAERRTTPTTPTGHVQ